MRRRKVDHLAVEVAIRVKKPKGVDVTAQALRDVVARWAEGEPLPRNVEIMAVFWRNPNRRPPLDRWRWHEGADLRKAPQPLESRSRGNLEDARSTLSGLLRAGHFSFR